MTCEIKKIEFFGIDGNDPYDIAVMISEILTNPKEFDETKIIELDDMRYVIVGHQKGMSKEEIAKCFADDREDRKMYPEDWNDYYEHALKELEE